MFVKITVPSQDNPPGEEHTELYECDSVRFETRPWVGDQTKPAYYAVMKFKGEVSEQLIPGDVFVMNSEGRTIDRWHPNKVHVELAPDTTEPDQEVKRVMEEIILANQGAERPLSKRHTDLVFDLMRASDLDAEMTVRAIHMACVAHTELAAVLNKWLAAKIEQKEQITSGVTQTTPSSKPAVKYEGPLPRPKCDCRGWGCFGCCNNDQEIRSRSGTFG